VLQLRRAITVLLHGAVCSEAAQALLTSQAAYSTAVMKGGSGWPVDNRLMYEFGSPNFERCALEGREHCAAMLLSVLLSAGRC